MRRISGAREETDFGFFGDKEKKLYDYSAKNTEKRHKAIGNWQ
jgi:hypothetical protein